MSFHIINYHHELIEYGLRGHTIDDIFNYETEVCKDLTNYIGMAFANYAVVSKYLIQKILFQFSIRANMDSFCLSFFSSIFNAKKLLTSKPTFKSILTCTILIQQEYCLEELVGSDALMCFYLDLSSPVKHSHSQITSPFNNKLDCFIKKGKSLLYKTSYNYPLVCF